MAIEREQIIGQGAKFHDEKLMPVRMGTPYRVPDYASPNWGLEYRDESLADQAYREEWAEGNSAQLDLVTQATIEAGLGDFPELLRRQAATVAGELFAHHQEPLRIADIGAGPGKSALAIYEALPEKQRQSAEIVLIDPSSESLVQAEALLSGKGARAHPIVGSDTDVLKLLADGQFNLISAVASIHHHSRIPFDEYYRALSSGGFLVVADWHHQLWEHPAKVFDFLRQMEWPNKTEGLINWLSAYPKASELPPATKWPSDETAIEQITEFWKAYQRIARQANLGPNAIWPLEGHRPVEKYTEAMEEAGFRIDSPRIASLIGQGIISQNPHQILPDSSLLQLTIGHK